MKILITNDDSISAPGLRALIDCAYGLGEITVVAPEYPQSGQSSAITVEHPLRIKRFEDYKDAKMYAVNGTPVDCVKLGLHALFDQKPDIILSGINHGSNSGNAIIYSGTMGAVIEGCMCGVSSIGFSLLDYMPNADFSLAAPFVREIIQSVIDTPLPPSIALNVNMPSHIVPKGIRTCRATTGYWSEEYKEYTDPFGRPFYMLTGNFVNTEPLAKDTDEYWLSEGYISVVPVTPDMTGLGSVNELSSLFDK